MIYNDEVETRLHERLRRPESPSTVPGSLPVLFFGDLPMARVASISLNPSRREYTNGKGEELEGLERRFETLRSLGAHDRAGLDAWQCNRAISTMRGYFDPGRPVYSWFSGLSRVMKGMGAPYWKRQAAHLDLVQEATDPTWSELASQRPDEMPGLLVQDRDFLRWQLETFPIQALICNGRTTLDAMLQLLNASVVGSGSVNGRRTWAIALAEVGSRTIAIAGWNIPLAQAPGLTRDAQVELGAMFKRELERIGITLS